jgi:hypothetical protein
MFFIQKSRPVKSAIFIIELGSRLNFRDSPSPSSLHNVLDLSSLGNSEGDIIYFIFQNIFLFVLVILFFIGVEEFPLLQLGLGVLGVSCGIFSNQVLSVIHYPLELDTVGLQVWVTPKFQGVVPKCVISIRTSLPGGVHVFEFHA